MIRVWYLVVDRNIGFSLAPGNVADSIGDRRASATVSMLFEERPIADGVQMFRRFALTIIEMLTYWNPEDIRRTGFEFIQMPKNVVSYSEPPTMVSTGG